jgi:hypothetical protein
MRRWQSREIRQASPVILTASFGAPYAAKNTGFVCSTRDITGKELTKKLKQAPPPTVGYSRESIKTVVLRDKGIHHGAPQIPVTVVRHQAFVTVQGLHGDPAQTMSRELQDLVRRRSHQRAPATRPRRRDIAHSHAPLIKLSPEPQYIIIGDLSNHDKLLLVLDVTASALSAYIIVYATRSKAAKYFEESIHIRDCTRDWQAAYRYSRV